MDKKEVERKTLLDLHPGSKEDLFQSWTSLFVLTKHWLSDMKFFRTELNFLTLLVDRYLLKLVEEANVSKIVPLTLALSKLEVRSHELGQKIMKHLQHFQELIENPFSHDSQSARDEHLALETELIDFVKDFRITKAEIFSSTEPILKSEKAKHLLTS
jgi:hypothetical protein